MITRQVRVIAMSLFGGSLLLAAAFWAFRNSEKSTVARTVSDTPQEIPVPVVEVANVRPALPLPPRAAAVANVQAPIPANARAGVRAPSRLDFGSLWSYEQKPELAAFADWAQRYVVTAGAGRAGLVPEGVALAQARREEMKQLIKTDPRQAIASTVPMAVRAQLPPEILAQLEARVSGTGDLVLLAITPAPGQAVAEPYSKSANVDGQWYRAYTYGRREAQQTKVGTSVIGVALDGALAVSESPLRVLEAGEVSTKPVSAVCPVSGQATAGVAGAPLNAGAQTAVEVAGAVQVLCHVEHVAYYESQLIRAEDAAGPYPVKLILGDSGPGTSTITGRPPISWSQGAKKALLIRVDFPDLTGGPFYTGTSTVIDAPYVNNVFGPAGGVSDFYDQASYHKTSLPAAPDVTPVYHLTTNAATYAQNNDLQLHTDAETLASANYNLASYDKIGVVFSNLDSFPGSTVTYGGRAEVQGKNFWINGWFNFGTLIHELGHTYGLQHSNLWKVTDGDPVSPNGTSIEYGDPYDPMGRNIVTVANHFNQWEKSLLQWIPDTAVQTVSADGLYRVYRFDHASANLTNKLALKIVRNSTQDYWIGLRRGLGNNGASIMWGYNAVQQSNLIDFTPATNADDSPLAVGTSFHDTAAGITFLVSAAGGSAPDEYLDVQVTFDSRISWSSTTYSFDESLGSATLTLQRTSSSVGSVSVNYATSDGTAIAPGDYAATSGTVTWINGDSAPKIITIPLSPDGLAEGIENLSVTLSAATGGAVIINGATATVNIADAGAADPGLIPDLVNSSVLQTIVQPDGKLLIAGWFDTIFVNGVGNARKGVARLNADGTIDAAFTGPGVDVVPVSAMALQADGKILIGGNFAQANGTARVRVARLNADGSLDPSFNPGTGPNAEVHALAIQPDGRILVGGVFTTIAGQTRGGIARLNPNGTLDSTFTGPTFLGFPNADILSIALQPDNKPMVAGSFYFNPAPYKSSVARLNTDGSLDPMFNPGYGAHVDGDNGYIQTVQKVAVQRDGMIIVGGYFTGFNNVTHNRLARLAANGTLDVTFNPSMDPAVPANTSPYPNVRTLLIQPDGRIVLGGTFAQVNGIAQSNFARLNSNGTLDNTFAVGSGSSGAVKDIALQGDGKVVLATDFGTIQGASNRTLARLFTAPPGLPGTVQFSTASYQAAEESTLAVTVKRTGGSFGAVSINYATQPGTAVSWRYAPVSGTLSWPSGDLANKTINIPLLNDGVPEPDQTFSLNLGIPTGGLFPGAPATASVKVTPPPNTLLLFRPSDLHTYVWSMNGPVTTGSAPGPTLPAGWSVADVRDFNGDGKPDLLLFNASDLRTYVWYMNGTTVIGSAPGPTLPAGWSVAGVGDFNADGKPDLFLFHASDLRTYVWYMNGTTVFNSAPGPTLPAGWSVADVGDFNYDGKPDLLLFHASDLRTYVYYMNGTTAYSSAPGPTLPAGWTVAGLGDFNADGKSDLFLFHASDLRTYVYYMNGPTAFGSAPGPTLPAGWVLAKP